ncbi:UNVERIFIED_CONTAM: hypothetical protein HDU68_004021 [Siphonaria sp. JEL0065]|nr:hypothetical protein HDU68_004021 [Siphonaria sp. JEL0065]
MTIVMYWTTSFVLLFATLGQVNAQETSAVPGTSTTRPSGTVPGSSIMPSPTGAPIELVVGMPKPRYGASAQLIRDQSLIVFFGGYVGTPQQGYYPDLSAPFELQPTESIVTLSVNRGFEFNTGNWNTLINSNLSIPAQNLDHDPRVTAFGSSVAARGVDVGTNQNVDIYYYMFGQNYNMLLDPYNQGNGIIGVINNQATAPPSRNRAMSCLIDGSTTIFHGGLSGIDNSVTTQTLSSTWFLSLKNLTAQQNAWQLKKTSSDQDPLLHSHMGACLSGNAYMVGGVSDKTDSDGNLVLASMDHMWVFSYTSSVADGVWTQVPLNGPKGFPVSRKSGTLTSADPSGNILYLHGGTATDFSETYSDLWQLDVKARQWTPLPSSKYPRHSHNTIFVNGMLINAFGAMSNANSTNPPPAITPPLWVFNTLQNTWGGFPGSAQLNPSAPPAYPAHVAAFLPSASAPGGSTAPTQESSTNPAIIYGIVGACVAGIVGIALFVFIHKRNNRRREKEYEREEELEDQIRESRASSSFAAVIGMTNQISDSSAIGFADRKVGGTLARVIERNQTTTGVYPRDFADDLPDSDKDEVRSIVSARLSLDLPSYVIGSEGITQDQASQDPVAVGASVSTILSDETLDTEKKEEVEPPITPNTRPSSAFFFTHPTLKGTTASLASLKRNSKLYNNKEILEPLRPWELPGMGVQRSSTSHSRASQLLRTSSPIPLGPRSASVASNRSRTEPNRADSRINLAGLIGDLPDVDNDETHHDADTYSIHSFGNNGAVGGAHASHGQSMSRQDSNKRYSSYSAASSSENSSAVTPSSGQLENAQYAGYFDPAQSMKVLFGKFSNEQILESWNAYSMSTGIIYGMDQVAAMRALHAPDTIVGAAGSDNVEVDGSLSPVLSSNESEGERPASGLISPLRYA